MTLSHVVEEMAQNRFGDHTTLSFAETVAADMFVFILSLEYGKTVEFFCQESPYSVSLDRYGNGLRDRTWSITTKTGEPRVLQR